MKTETAEPSMDEWKIVDDVIRRRRTWKVLADPADPVQLSTEAKALGDAMVRQSVATAGWAPFHYPRNSGGLAEPWRFHILFESACRDLAQRMPEWFDDIRPGNKLSAMLSACGALVIINWIPQFDENQSSEKQLQVNEEHLAATSAATQNLLLLLTAAGLGTYWSSGSLLRRPTMFEKLQMNANEKLIAAIFVDYSSDVESGQVTDRIAGKLCNARNETLEWVREIDRL